MSTTPAPQPKSPRVPPALIGAGVLVIALGFALPMLTPAAAPEIAPSDPAARQAPPLPIAPPNAPNLVASLLKLVLVAKWVGPKTPPAPGLMDVAASIAVGPCVLHLVRAGDRRLLVGTDPGGVKAVLELPGAPPEAPPDPPAASEPAAEPESLTQQKLLDLLLQLRGRSAATPPG